MKRQLRHMSNFIQRCSILSHDDIVSILTHLKIMNIAPSNTGYSKHTSSGTREKERAKCEHILIYRFVIFRLDH